MMDNLLKSGTLERMTGDMEPQSLDMIVKTMALPKPLPEPPVTCERCKDMGWLRVNVPYSHPQFGKPVKCRCRQQEQASAQKSAAYSECYTWLGDTAGDLERMTFEGFTWRGDSPSICLAYSTVKKLAGRFAKGGQELPNLLFIGPPGVGKTHLVASLLNTLRTSGIGCLYCTAQGLFNAFYAASFEYKPALMAQAGGTLLLAIDEMDKLHIPSRTDGHSYQMDMLFELLNRRYKQHLPTAILSNEEVSLGRWLDKAALDRLGEHCEWHRMTGASYRQRGKDGAR